MKTIILIFSLFLLGCDNDTPKEDPNNIPQELIGKWKIVQVYDSHGGNAPYWLDHETSSNYEYWFKDNGEYLRNDGYYHGSFVISDDFYIIFTSSLTQNSDEDYIEFLNQDTLIIDRLNFEPSKNKYIKVSP